MLRTNPWVIAAASRMSLDTKLLSTLTLTELEATARLGLTGFLTLNSTRVACEEALVRESLLVLGINLHEGAGNGEAQGLALAGEATTIKVSLYIILLSNFQECQWLLNHILKDS